LKGAPRKVNYCLQEFKLALGGTVSSGVSKAPYVKASDKKIWLIYTALITGNVT
jgi:hypothetical protein